MSEHINTVVIGGGQAGLAAGYYLRRRDLSFVVLDENERVGDAWRQRWDTLRLFTPGRYNDLPGMPFPAARGVYPTKDQAADYLEGYAREFEIPVRTGVTVHWPLEGRQRIRGGIRRQQRDRGQRCGGHRRLPPSEDPHVRPGPGREHRPAPLQRVPQPRAVAGGDVLLVGAGNSGAEIGLDLADQHRVWLSGPDTGQEPTAAGTLPDRLLTPLMWFAATRFTVRTPMGRKLRDHFTRPSARHSPRPGATQGHQRCGDRAGRAHRRA